ncbi:Ig-like domain-containing protein [Chloroflexota bacterium]
MSRATMVRKYRGLFLLALFALLLAACGPAGPEATPTQDEPTSQPTIAPPTETPPPTATPFPLPAPRLLYRSPAPGEEQPLDAPIELTFDQPMDPASVEAVFAISPTVEGVFTWSDDRTVGFVAEGLERGVRHTVSVAATARNIEGTALEDPILFDFGTVGYLAVSEVIPGPNRDELAPDTTVTVVFDRPVVPLAAISQQGELPDPLTFVPPVRGEGEWLNTSIYVFRPEDGLLPATRYKARVASGLADTTGGILAEDYIWEFATIRPAVLKVWPEDRFSYVGPSDVISVTFNQPMDHASVQTAFSLEADGIPLEGTFRWSGVETPVAPETMVFQPDEPLAREMSLVASVSAGARARKGDMGTERDEIWRFATVQNPGIVTTSPLDGEENVHPGDSVRITFASPMQREGFLDRISVRPQVTKVYTYWNEYDTKVRIYFDRDPASRYRVTLDAETPDRYGVPLGEPARIRFTTGDLSSFAALNTGGRLGTFNAYTDTMIYATHRNVSSLDLKLYRLSVLDFVRLNSDWRAWDRFVPAEADLVRGWSQKVEVPRNEAHVARLDLVKDEDVPLTPGLYYVQLTAPEVEKAADYRPESFMFVKERVNLTMKQTGAEALIWATDLASGQPVAGLPVTLYDDTRQVDSGGTTDADGIFLAQGLQIENLWEAFFAVAGEPGEDDFGISYNAWDNGISPWSFDVASEFWNSEYLGYAYTDRPIYRPGQTVYFKGIVRADDDASYSLPDQIEEVQVQISDPQGKDLYKEKLTLGDMGTLFDELLLDEEAALGTYYIGIQDEEHDLYTGTSFRVAEYKKPEFEVSVKSDRDAYLDGETVQVAAEGTYYFGGPVADADVHWSVLSSSYSYRYQCPQGHDCPWYSWTDFEWGGLGEDEYYGSYGRLIAEGDAQTDDQGRVAFQVPADIAQEIQSQFFTIEVSVTDVNGQQVSTRTTMVVHKGEFYIGVAPRGYLAEAGEAKEVDLLTVDWDGEPVEDVPLTVVFMEHRWYSVRKQAEDGGYYWDWTSEDVPVMTTTVTTGDTGQATTTFTPSKAGSYRVRAVGRDEHENEIRSSAYFWVWGGTESVSWRRESTNRIELIADKEEYQIGDVAEILIPSPYSGTVQALVTIERGHVMEMEARELRTNSDVLRVPISEEYVPNVFVSVVVVQGSEQAADGLATFKMGVVKLPVSLEAKELTITLTPDKDLEAGETYSPRQTATYDALVTDDDGEPAEAELSLRLADLAVLALADESGPTLLETFWRSRGLGVKTSMPLAVAMEQYNRELEPRAKGGGGGGDGEGLIRTRFADTAFWDPVVRTGEDGRAQVTVQLPDNLTTWRMQARGITADTKVGRAEVDAVSTLDLLVRSVLPRFFVVGDQAELATVVHNNTGKALEVDVNISVEGLVLEGDVSQAVEVPAGGKAKVTWPVRVLPGDEVDVRMWAKAGELYDGREDTLPVYRYSTPEVVATAGHLSEAGLRQEIIQLPGVYDASQGELTVQVDGSLTAATQDALDYLEHYPYECVEQTVSRFLPNVVTWQALVELGIERPELQQKLAEMVGGGLQRLYAEQHYDGGWGWWVTEKSDAYLTGYALQGMLEARRADFTVDEDVMDRAVDFLRDNLPSVRRVDTHWEANRLAFQLYVLAEYGAEFNIRSSKELGLAVGLYEKRQLLDRYGQATLALALSLLEPEEPSRAGTLMDDLAGDAIVSATGTHWEEDEPDYWNMNTDIRTTAIVIWALSRLEPDSELLPNSVRWLMAARQEGHWETTQGTAWSLLGLVEYMRASGELEGDYSYTVYLNGEELAGGDVTSENIDENRRLQIEVARLLVEEGNRLVIERHAAQPGQTGEGQLYYTAQQRTYVPADHVKALDRGIIVARQYSPVDSPDEFVDSAQVGDVIKVKLTLIAPSDLYYVVVEDPLPAGFEGVDQSLKTTSVVGEGPELRNVTAEEADVWSHWYGWGWWWFSHTEMRDEKVALFSQYLPRGTYEYTYLMRAGVPGEFNVIPTTAYQMYAPEVFGRSDGGRFLVEPTN